MRPLLNGGTLDGQGEMEIQRSCEVATINWQALVELPNRLERLGFVVTSESVDVNWFPDTVKTDSLARAVGLVQERGDPHEYSLYLRADDRDHAFRLTSGTNIHRQRYLYIEVEAPEPEPLLQSAMQLLDLRPREPVAAPSRMERTAFIAHRFDEVGSMAASTVARFLELLDFNVVTGRSYVPGPISEKVRGRIAASAVVIVLLTAGSDDTWLVQESTLGNATGKPIIILKASNANFTSGLFADHEFIPFTNERIETTLVPLLEGLRELGYVLSDSPSRR